VVIVLDSASLYYRAFHALPESMTAPDGYPNNAVRGFLTTVARLVRQHECGSLIAAWDDDWRPQWRVDLLPSYKAHRVADVSTGESFAEEAEAAEPLTLGPQASAIARLLMAGGIPVLGAPGFEADDIAATVAHAAPSIVVTGDRDLVQVVTSRTRVHLAVNGGMEKWPLLDEDGVRDRFGVRADQYVDLAVLRGDPSDGLPGVAGIGAKTAVALLQEWNDIDGVLSAARSGAGRPLTPRLAGLLLEAEDYLSRARQVATARIDAPVRWTNSRGQDTAEARSIAEEWGVSKQWSDLLKAVAQADT
jgi:5'-3' exonuclease